MKKSEKKLFFCVFTVFENPKKVVFLTFFGISGAKIVGILHQKKGRKSLRNRGFGKFNSWNVWRAPSPPTS